MVGPACPCVGPDSLGVVKQVVASFCVAVGVAVGVAVAVGVDVGVAMFEERFARMNISDQSDTPAEFTARTERR